MQIMSLSLFFSPALGWLRVLLSRGAEAGQVYQRRSRDKVIPTEYHPFIVWLVELACNLMTLFVELRAKPHTLPAERWVMPSFSEHVTLTELVPCYIPFLPHEQNLK